jgi:hypothetical protein
MEAVNVNDKIIKDFEKMIDLVGIEYVHESLLEVYFDYSQLLMKSEGLFCEGASDRLYNLSSLIKVLDGKF